MEVAIRRQRLCVCVWGGGKGGETLKNINILLTVTGLWPSEAVGVCVCAFAIYVCELHSAQLCVRERAHAVVEKFLDSPQPHPPPPPRYAAISGVHSHTHTHTHTHRHLGALSDTTRLFGVKGTRWPIQCTHTHRHTHTHTHRVFWQDYNLAGRRVIKGGLKTARAKRRRNPGCWHFANFLGRASFSWPSPHNWCTVHSYHIILQKLSLCLCPEKEVGTKSSARR